MVSCSRQYMSPNVALRIVTGGSTGMDTSFHSAALFLTSGRSQKQALWYADGQQTEAEEDRVQTEYPSYGWTPCLPLEREESWEERR